MRAAVGERLLHFGEKLLRFSDLDLGYFFVGFLPDPEGLLVGNGKRMRHLKIKSVQESENPAITSLLAHTWADGLKRVEHLHHRRA